MVAKEVKAFRLLYGRTKLMEDTWVSVKFDIPAKVDAGAEVPFYVAGHIDQFKNYKYFATAFTYESGPMSEISVSTQYGGAKLRPGESILVRIGLYPEECTTATIKGTILKLDAGKYRFSASAGTITDDGQYLPAKKIEATVDSVGVLWSWWLLPIATVAGIVTAVGAVLYVSERRREEELLLLTRKRL
jgi:hypothetical protein